ncbi:hypothetical protein D3C71_2024160 [compost metagenome]
MSIRTLAVKETNLQAALILISAETISKYQAGRKPNFVQCPRSGAGTEERTVLADGPFESLAPYLNMKPFLSWLSFTSGACLALHSGPV